MMNTLDLKIKQSGKVICPICYNHIDWSYKMEIMHMRDGMIVPCPEVKPHYHIVSHYFKRDGKIVFRIGCERCGSVIETEPMELMESSGT